MKVVDSVAIQIAYIIISQYIYKNITHILYNYIWYIVNNSLTAMEQFWLFGENCFVYEADKCGNT